jgi:hypothetical protein
MRIFTSARRFLRQGREDGSIGGCLARFTKNLRTRIRVQLAFQFQSFKAQASLILFHFTLYKYTCLYKNLGPLECLGPVQLAHTAHVAARDKPGVSSHGLSSECIAYAEKKSTTVGFFPRGSHQVISSFQRE